MSADRVSRLPEGELIDGRYRVRRFIGRGGSAEVYEVLDVAVDRVVALKQFREKTSADGAEARSLSFEREYYTLAGLSHPSIIAVHDCGVVDGSPYYTMELLGGRDLRELSPVPWRVACEYLRDVASSLALLHSRKLLHRDVTPRNILVGADGRAKLVDFGALTAMGHAAVIVGTPPCIPPEALNWQPLDGRADLYALGATAYWALTGHHAHPAARIAELPERWETPIVPPRAHTPDVPQALESLVLSLLSKDPRARPRHAMEVSERLAAIADLPHEDELSVGSAYLSVPAYCGQTAALELVRGRLRRTAQGRGGALFVEGKPGAGRSRFLDVCLLEAKIMGALTARVRAAGMQPYAALRTLVEDLLTGAEEAALTTLAPHAAAIREVLPEALRLFPAVTGAAEPAPGARRDAQSALLEWIVALSALRPIVVLADDVQTVDEPSGAFLAALARSAPRGPLLVVTSAPSAPSDSQREPSARVLAAVSEPVVLGSIGRDALHDLVQSIFGDVPNVTALAERLFAHTRGNPGSCLAFIRHLVDQGLVHFERGAWWLPERIDGATLPRTTEDALGSVVASLPPDARVLALGVALSQMALSLDDIARVLPDASAEERFGALSELVRLGLLEAEGAVHRFTQATLGPVVIAAAEPAERRKVHGRVAELLSSRGDRPMHAIHHWFQAAEPERATDLLLATLDRLERGQVRFDLDWLRHLQPNAERALELCEQGRRPRRQAFQLRQSMILLSYLVDPSLAATHGEPLEAYLREALGVAHWPELGDLPEAARVRQGLERASEAFEALPEAERALSPDDALEALGRYASLANNPYTLMLDMPALARLIELIRPFTFLSPALRLAHLNLLGSQALDASNTERAEMFFREALALLDTEGKSIRHRTMVRCGVLFGLSHARVFYADPAALEWSLELDGHPLQRINAWRIRRFHHLFSGNAAQAQICAAKIEALSLESETVRTIDGGTVFTEMLAAAHGGDLLQFGTTLERMAVMAQRYPNHVASHKFALATYERLRGNLTVARAHYEDALAGLGPTTHAVWPNGHEGYIETLIGLGEAALARRVATDAFDLAVGAGLGWQVCAGLEGVLACAEADVGERERALARLVRIVTEGEKRGLAPLLLSRHYERAARVALAAGDAPLAQDYTARLAALASRTENPVLLARVTALETHLRGDSMRPADSRPSARGAETTHFRTVMTGARGEVERARCALALLISHAGALGGHLYRAQGGALSLVASSPEGAPAMEFGQELSARWGALAADAEPVTETVMTAANPFSREDGDALVPLLLSRPGLGPGHIAGLVVLRMPGGSVARVPSEIVEIACELLDLPPEGLSLRG